MSTLSKRLDKVEEELDSIQLFLKWLDEVHEEHGSLASFVESVADDIEVAAPLPGLIAQMETSVRSTSRGKGLRPQQVQERVQTATWEVALLFHLHLQLNLQFLRERRGLWLSLAHAARDCAEVFGQKRPDQKGLTTAHDCLIVCIREILEWDQAVDQLADSYMPGASLLFPDAAEELATLVGSAAQCGKLFTDGSQLVLPPAKGKKGPKALAVDLAQLYGEAEDGTAARIDRLLDLARAEAWQITGERKRATDRLVAHARRPEGGVAPPGPPPPATLSAGGTPATGTPQHTIFLKFLHQANRARALGEAAAREESSLDFVGRILARAPQRTSSSYSHSPSVGVNIYLPGREIR